MLKQQKLYSSSTGEFFSNKLKLANIIQKIISKKIEITNIIPLELNDIPNFNFFLEETIKKGFILKETKSLNDLHATLFLLYDEIFKPIELSNDMQFHPGLIWVRNKIEEEWIKFELDNLSNERYNMTTQKHEFEKKFNNLWKSHRYMTHPFHNYVKTTANKSELKNLFITESVCASRFADMVALSLPGIPRINSAVSEVMENLTDELGSKKGTISHKELYSQLLDYLKIDIPIHPLDSLLPFGWRAIRGLNLFIYNAIHRKNYYRMIGAIGAGEVTFPFFCENVLVGSKRNGITDENAIIYHFEHSTLDIEHGENWLRKVIIPFLDLSENVQEEILLGLELQLTVTSEYYDSLYEYWNLNTAV